MSEQVPVAAEQAVPTAPKQYMLMVDEATVASLSRVIPELRFVQVQGLVMKDNTENMVLVTPFPKMPVPETVPVPSANTQEIV